MNPTKSTAIPSILSSDIPDPAHVTTAALYHLVDELRDRIDRLQGLLESIPAYVYVVHMENGMSTITEHGRGCFAVTGYRPEDYAADPGLWFSMIYDEDRSKVLEHIAREQRDENPGPLEHRIRHRTGTIRWLRNTVVHRHDDAGRLVGYDGLIEDITDRKQATEALRSAYDELEQRVHDRTAQLAATNEELRKALGKLETHDRARVQFVSNVSHDLKTPVVSMTYAVNNLLSGIGGALSDKVVAYLKMMGDDCRRLRTTVEDILDMTRLEENRFFLNRVRILFAPCLQRLVDALRGQAEAKGLFLNVEIDACGFVDCDPNRTERALTNIVQNAIKFTEPGGAVDIHAFSDGQGAIVIEVTDDGVGIEPDKLAHVGERYFRASERVPGSGLGLSIARDIVHLHDGSLQVVSPPPGRERGTQVTIRLPTAAPATIAIADADESTRKLLARQLGARGYRMLEADTSQALLELMKQDGVALVVMHFGLPGMSGPELVTAIKANSQWRRIPIIVLTGVVIEREGIEMLRRFEIPALSKPWREEELFELVFQAHLGQAHLG